jgi:hypothetical protein
MKAMGEPITPQQQQQQQQLNAWLYRHQSTMGEHSISLNYE